MTHSTSERRHATLPPLPALLRVASFHTLRRVNDQDTMSAHPQERGDVLPGCQPWHVIGWRRLASAGVCDGFAVAVAAASAVLCPVP